MVMASPFDGLVGLGGTPATLYASDGVSVQATTVALLSNVREMPITGARGDDIRGILPSSVVAQPGMVLYAAAIPPVWYLVRKVIVHTPGLLALATELSLLGMPYQLSVLRVSATQRTAARNPWLELAGSAPTDTSGRIPGSAVSHTVRVGFSNSNDPTTETIVGPQENGLFTAYTPLRSDLQHGDPVALLDGRPAQVDTLNTLYADGTAYGLQAVLRLTGGSGLT